VIYKVKTRSNGRSRTLHALHINNPDSGVGNNLPSAAT
jgi:hypothetical protein